MKNLGWLKGSSEVGKVEDLQNNEVLQVGVVSTSKVSGWLHFLCPVISDVEQFRPKNGDVFVAKKRLTKLIRLTKRASLQGIVGKIFEPLGSCSC